LRYNDIVFTNSPYSRFLCRMKYMFGSMRSGSKGYRNTILSAKMSQELSIGDIYINGSGTITGVGQAHTIHIVNSIGRYMNIIMEKFQKAVIYTTKTEIKRTMFLKTWNVSRYANILDCTCQQKSEKRSRERALVKLWSLLKLGTLVKTVLSGTVSTQKTVSQKEKSLIKHANTVESTIRPLFCTRNIVQTPAKQGFATRVVLTMKTVLVKFAKKCSVLTNMLLRERVQRVVPLNYRNVTVYDIEVDGDNCYYANGILVSNCDAARYLAIVVSRGLNGDNRSMEDLNRKYLARV